MEMAACAGLLAVSAVFAGCGSEDKVAVVDYQQLEIRSEKIKGIQEEIVAKNKEISDRLAKAEGTVSAEEMQKKQPMQDRSGRFSFRASSVRSSRWSNRSARRSQRRRT